MPTLRAALALLRPRGAALATLALFLAAGLAVLDDYGASADSVTQRTISSTMTGRKPRLWRYRAEWIPAYAGMTGDEG